MLVGILRNEDPRSSDNWEIACNKHNVNYKVINLTGSRWFEELLTDKFDILLTIPPGSISRYKILYDERLYIVVNLLGYKIFPTYEECIIYENKRMLSYFLKARNIPHPKTCVFYDYLEAQEFIENSKYPFVAKSNIGAAGSGVKIIRTKKEALKYAHKAFKGAGIRRRFGPNRVTGVPSKWFIKAIRNPHYLKMKMREYIERHKDSQYGFVIFQEYITHDFEWRSIKIGDSYFAHKKLKQGDKASGVKGSEFVDPPKKLLEFTKNVCETNNFHSMAIDIFEDDQGGYLVNELQTIFGPLDKNYSTFSHLKVDGKPGRYIYRDNNWIFEEGDFNTNGSFDLRLGHALKLCSLHS